MPVRPWRSGMRFFVAGEKIAYKDQCVISSEGIRMRRVAGSNPFNSPIRKIEQAATHAKPVLSSARALLRFPKNLTRPRIWNAYAIIGSQTR